jgi:hypothetical protein
MTLEQECFGGDQDYSWKQRWLSRSMRKLGEQPLPGAPYGEQYFQNSQRRNVGVYTLKSAFSTIHGFMGLLRKHRMPHLSPFTQGDLEA